MVEKKNIDWSSLGFGYVKTDKRFVANYKDGAWDNGTLTDDDKVVINYNCREDSDTILPDNMGESSYLSVVGEPNFR